MRSLALVTFLLSIIALALATFAFFVALADHNQSAQGLCLLGLFLAGATLLFSGSTIDSTARQGRRNRRARR